LSFLNQTTLSADVLLRQTETNTSLIRRTLEEEFKDMTRFRVLAGFTEISHQLPTTRPKCPEGLQRGTKGAAIEVLNVLGMAPKVRFCAGNLNKGPLP